MQPRLPSGARGALENADRYELLSLDPERPEVEGPGDFMLHHVLGSVVITDKAVQAKLNDALRAAVKSDFMPSIPRCFNPRHGLRVTCAGKTYSFLICFECEKVRSSFGSWFTDPSPLGTFNKVLQDAGVPLPKEAE